MKTAPLAFVHGTIMAVEAIVTASKYRNEELLFKNTDLLLLETALEDLSYTWTIASHARLRLQALARNSRCEEPCSGSQCSPSEPTEPASNLSADPIFEVFQAATYSIPHLSDIRLSTSHFNVVPTSIFDASNSYDWSEDSILADRYDYLQNITPPFLETCFLQEYAELLNGESGSGK